jgi:hypothetical protein
MAIRGIKPKPSILKLVTGGPGKAPAGEIPVDPALIDPGYDNHLEPPRKLSRRQNELWNSYIRKARWLTPFDVPRAFMWVELHARFERKPGDMVAGMIAQLRALGSELGLDPSSRARIGTSKAKHGNIDPADSYFQD